MRYSNVGRAQVDVYTLAEQVTAGRYKRTVTMFGRTTDDDRAILAAIEEPVSLKLYFSARAFAGIPELQSHGVRVREISDIVDGRVTGDDSADILAGPITLGGKGVLAVFEFDAGSLVLTEAGTQRRASIHLVAGRDALARPSARDRPGR